LVIKNLLMKKSLFSKEKITSVDRNLAKSSLKLLKQLYELAFAKRTILFVTNKKIRSLSLGPISQLCIILTLALISNLVMQTLRYDQIVSAKSQEISKLRSVNEYFEEEVEVMNDKLAKINEYLSTLGVEVHDVKSQEIILKNPANLEEKNLPEIDSHTFKQMEGAKNKLNNIQSVARGRIKKIEEIIALTGLNLKKMPNKILQKESASMKKERFLAKKRGTFLAQGGPISEDSSLEALMHDKSSKEDDLEKRLEKVKFANEIDYLIVLEKVAKSLPLARPMKNYYISSSFGTRRDPLTGKRAKHQGLDFVGMNKEKIISPSEGKVILAGRFSDYGNAVVIDHGFGITTRYGHLSEVRVKDGQIVKKGDVLALQGSTGRSTGQHLHYEIRYKNVALNPKRFLDAGENFFKDAKIPKHVNS